MSDEKETTPKKPSLPEGYSIPNVWSMPEPVPGMPFSNLPTANVRAEKVLAKGSHPFQLYSLGTPNGQKCTILLEELKVEYDAFKINIGEQEQFGSDFSAICPNQKIPALLDMTQTPPQRVFESGSIMLYLAEKYDQFIPKTVAGRTECMSWLFWQMSTAPFIGGGFGHFYNYAPIQIEYAINRYAMEVKRILSVLDIHLEGKTYVCGDEYTIADMAILPYVLCLDVGYKAADFLQLESYLNVSKWKTTLLERDAVKRGLRVNGFGPDAVKERHSSDDFN